MQRVPRRSVAHPFTPATFNLTCLPALTTQATHGTHQTATWALQFNAAYSPQFFVTPFAKSNYFLYQIIFYDLQEVSAIKTFYEFAVHHYQNNFPHFEIDWHFL
ncbi:hypothetical protein [Burkholderia ubonensis]|uniref:hypothetical protein n=1 Tax=Burkholderia ubonensis TaxID=101571 RepID=UPI000B0C62EA|nr:hypothetical protein [Burkholderia ubonensis]